MYMNGEHISGSKLDITGTPIDAQYKEGKVFSALSNARRMFEQHDILLDCRVILKEFFTRHTFLSSDSSRAYEELQEILQKAKEIILDLKEPEKSLLGLYENVSYEYPNEPLLKLLQSSYLRDNSQNFMGLNLVRVQIFLLISS